MASMLAWPQVSTELTVPDSRGLFCQLMWITRRERARSVAVLISYGATIKAAMMYEYNSNEYNFVNSIYLFMCCVIYNVKIIIIK
jgi:hypothetical protein